MHCVMLQNEVLLLNSADEVNPTIAVGQPPVALLIDDEIKRHTSPWRSNWHSAILSFVPAIEKEFENGTRAARARELRFSVALGLILFLLTTITDFVFVPDLRLNAFLMRLIVAPFFLLFILTGSKLSARVREALAVATAIFAIVVLATITAISSAPWAPFAFTTASLGLIYANTTFPLRFKYACVCSAICTLTIAAEIFAQSALSFDLRWSLVFQACIACLFSTVTSYRIERNVRLNFLFASRESLRLSRLSADREALATLSNTDALTGALNRRHFGRQSAEIFANPENAGKGASLLFIDVDHFKNYNDYYGHPAGDACLCAVYAGISNALRGTNNLAARYGGEEFAVLLLGVSKSQAKSIAVSVCNAISAQAMPHLNRPDGIDIVSISIGVAHRAIDAWTTLDDLIQTSDKALYDAKKKGRNQVSASEQRHGVRSRTNPRERSKVEFL
jgi:diguanylate cyclase (GGDEF)-like protein